MANVYNQITYTPIEDEILLNIDSKRLLENSKIPLYKVIREMMDNHEDGIISLDTNTYMACSKFLLKNETQPHTEIKKKSEKRMKFFNEVSDTEKRDKELSKLCEQMLKEFNDTNYSNVIDIFEENFKEREIGKVPDKVLEKICISYCKINDFESVSRYGTILFTRTKNSVWLKSFIAQSIYELKQFDGAENRITNYYNEINNNPSSEQYFPNLINYCASLIRVNAPQKALEYLKKENENIAEAIYKDEMNEFSLITHKVNALLDINKLEEAKELLDNYFCNMYRYYLYSKKDNNVWSKYNGFIGLYVKYYNIIGDNDNVIKSYESLKNERYVKEYLDTYISAVYMKYNGDLKEAIRHIENFIKISKKSKHILQIGKLELELKKIIMFENGSKDKYYALKEKYEEFRINQMSPTDINDEKRKRNIEKFGSIIKTYISKYRDANINDNDYDILMGIKNNGPIDLNQVTSWKQAVFNEKIGKYLDRPYLNIFNEDELYDLIEDSLNQIKNNHKNLKCYVNGFLDNYLFEFDHVVAYIHDVPINKFVIKTNMCTNKPVDFEFTFENHDDFTNKIGSFTRKR